MGTCEPGQGRKSAAISSHLFVRWVSHRRPTRVSDARLDAAHSAGSSATIAAPNSTDPPMSLPLDIEPPTAIRSQRAASDGRGGRIRRRRPPLSAADVRRAGRPGARRPGAGRRDRQPTASGTPTCSPAPAASARRRRRAFWPRRSNCEHGPTPTPCNECDICQSIGAGERRRRAGDRRRQQPRHRRDSPAAAERQHPPQPGPVQDLHHRRSPHAHDARPSTPCSRRWKSRPST